MSFHEKLTTLLRTDGRFVNAEGELIPPVVTSYARQFDRDLISVLLADPDTKSRFFDEIEGHWIFKVYTFVDYVSDKNFLDNSYTRFRNRIGLTIDGRFLRERGEVSLAWPYKDCVLEGGQTDEEQKRKEVFFNEILAQDEIDRLFSPKVLVGWKRYAVEGELAVSEISRGADGTIQENLLIRGNNLIALHTLKQQFRGKVKLIYIDPPFNTKSAANTFAYNNSFNHSSWLTFMKNRIEIARSLLTEDGIMAVSIDHSELFYLGVLLDELFGRENRMGVIAVVHNPGGRQDEDFFPTAHENLLFYAKDSELASLNRLGRSERKLAQFKEKDEFGAYKLRGFRRSGNNSRREDRPRLFYPIYYNPTTDRISLEEENDSLVEILPIDEQGTERCWRWEQETLMAKEQEYIEVKESRNGYKIYLKERESDYKGEKAKTIWNESYYSGQTATQGIKKLFGERVFSYPKSPFIIRDIIEITTKPGDIVLDFFAGSATTAAVAHKMNRRWITVEQMDYVEEISLERLKKVVGRNSKGGITEFDAGGISSSVNWQGGGDFIYCEMMRYNQAYLDDIQNALTSETLEYLWGLISENSFLNWYVNPMNPTEAIEEFRAISQKENGLAEQKKILIGLLNKNQLYVNLSDIRDEDFAVSLEDRALNAQFYSDHRINGEVK